MENVEENGEEMNREHRLSDAEKQIRPPRRITLKHVTVTTETAEDGTRREVVKPTQYKYTEFKQWPSGDLVRHAVPIDEDSDTSGTSHDFDPTKSTISSQ